MLDKKDLWHIEEPTNTIHNNTIALDAGQERSMTHRRANQHDPQQYHSYLTDVVCHVDFCPIVHDGAYKSTGT